MAEAKYDTAALRALLARLEAASGPDREIDQDLYCDLGLCPRGEDAILDAYRAPRYSESLDAAVALVERVLPGWSFLMAWNGERSIANVHIAPLGTDQTWARAGEGPTPALALCAALCRALLTRAETEA